MIPQLLGILFKYSITIINVTKEYHKLYRVDKFFDKLFNIKCGYYNYRSEFHNRGIYDNNGNHVCSLPKAYVFHSSRGVL